MKKIFLSLVFMIFASLAISQTSFEVDGIHYSILSASSKTVSVFIPYGNPKGTTYFGDISIPSTISYLEQVYRVTSIDSRAFYYCEGLTSITIPSTVTVIGEAAFYGCTGLAYINIPSSVSYIGPWAFTCCNASLNVDSDNVFFASREGALYNKNFTTLIHCPASFENDFTIPASLKTIGKAAFYGCTSLTSLTFPYSVLNIGPSAFYGCTSLTSITIPYSVTSIGSHAFYGCTSLASVTMYSSVKSIGDWAFYGCKSLTSISIPPSVTTIGGAVFSDCTASIIVDPINPNYSSKDGVLYNKDFTTFIHCPTSLKNGFTIPASANSIEAFAFYGCSSLTSITIPSTVNSIGYYAFYGCSSLTTMTIPSSVNSIGYCTFYDCTSLTSITIPSSVTAIGDMAFSGCTSLASITIPSTTHFIENHAFYCCNAFIHVDSNNLNYSSKDGVLYDKNYTTLIQCPTSLLNGITIPGTVKKIEDDAFGVCRGLTSITIPESVTSIGMFAFAGCTSLSTIISYISSPTNLLDHDTFKNVDTTNCKLYVPLGTSSLYKAAIGWKDFKNIIEFDATVLETQGPESINIYPNPTSKFIHIDLASFKEVHTLRIFNANGQKFYETRELDNCNQIDVSGFPSGLYYIQTSDQKNRLITIGKFLRN